VTKHLRVTIEIGPKGKKVAAVAPDWPGLERGAKTEEAAVGHLASYIPRYEAVAQLAGMQDAFKNFKHVEVVDRYTGPGSTDFWGISFGFSSIDKGPMSVDELHRELRLLRACWAFFDKVRSRVSAKLQKGPRGGGRDRDAILRHIFANEQDWVKKLGVVTPDNAMRSAAGMKTHRDSLCQAVRDFHAQGKMARNWPLRYLIRHTAYHTLDHAWEMEDKDLSPKRGPRRHNTAA
jgi:hypothetical protein